MLEKKGHYLNIIAIWSGIFTIFTVIAYNYDVPNKKYLWYNEGVISLTICVASGFISTIIHKCTSTNYHKVATRVPV